MQLKRTKVYFKKIIYPLLNLFGDRYVISFYNDKPKQEKLRDFTINLSALDKNFLNKQKLIREPYDQRNNYLIANNYENVILDSFTGVVLNENFKIKRSSLKYPSLVPYTYLSKIDKIDNLLADSNQEFYFLSSLNAAYYHKWFDGFIQLHYLHQFRKKIVVIVPDNVPANFKELLTYFNNDFEFIYKKSRFIKLPNLLKFKHISWAKHAPIITPDTAHFFKERILNKNSEIKTYDKIFIGRKNITTRKIINNDVVIALFEDFDFKVVYLEDYSISEQAYLFNNANYIAGLHGAGFTNLIFCKPNTKVLELQNLANVTTYFMISNQLNLKYHYVLPNEYNFNNIKDPYEEERSFFKQKLEDTSYEKGEIESLLNQIIDAK